MSKSDLLVLQALLQALDVGTEFYLTAVSTAENIEHKRIFQRIYTVRTGVQSYLVPYTQLTENSPEPIHAFGSFLHKIYPEMLSGLDNSTDTELLGQLKVIEQDTLIALQTALDGVQSPLLKSVILDLHPKLICRKHQLQHYDRAS
jgi:hypothetical protein